MMTENENQEMVDSSSRPNWLTRLIHAIIALFTEKKEPEEPPVDTPPVGNAGDPGMT